MDHQQLFLFSALLFYLSLTIVFALNDTSSADNGTSVATNETSDMEFLEKTSDCVKDLPPGSRLKFHLYPSTYEELIKRNDFFIDKSLLLEEVFGENSSFLTIFYLPHKFGKSINLQMIRFFCEIKLDSNRAMVTPNNTSAYDFFTRGKLVHENNFVELLVSPPLISRRADLIDQHLGQYPVVYLNFSNVEGSDYISAWNGLKDRIGDEFRRYSFLVGRTSTNNESIRFGKLVEYFDRMRGIEDREQLSNLVKSIECLSKVVGQFYNKKPMLMIDDYDTLIDSFLHQRYVTKAEDDKVLKFFNDFIRVLGFTRSWCRIILTGTYSIYKASLEPAKVSKTIYQSLGNNISYYFGFTERDVESLSKHFGMTDEQLRLAQDTYRGYRMGPHYPIYNPWSILKYFQTKQLENHWEQSLRYSNFLKNLFLIDKMRNVWLGLLGDRPRCVIHLFESFTERDIWDLKNILAIKAPIHRLSPKKFTRVLMYLSDAGHLTWLRFRETAPLRTFNVWLPNEDIKRSSFLRLRAAYTNHLEVKTSLADEAASKLHAYLSSDRPGQLFLDVMTSFLHLYNESQPLFETDPKYLEPKPKPKARHIVDYIGLRLRYAFEYQVDPMFMNGFMLRKSNITNVVTFNYNQSVESGDVLERHRNYTHPWTTYGLETKTVKIVVISISNDSDTHILSYVNNFTADYSPPTDTLVGITFENTSSTDNIISGQTSPCVDLPSNWTLIGRVPLKMVSNWSTSVTDAQVGIENTPAGF